MRDLWPPIKKTHFLDRFADWLLEHPIKGIVLIVAIWTATLFLMAFLVGCASRPPRFENGDKTVFGPKPYGDVDEPDMKHPSISDN